MSKCHLARMEACGARTPGWRRSGAALVLGSIALALQALAVETAGSSGEAPTADPAALHAVIQTTEVFEVERVLDAAGMVERRLVPAEDLVAGDELRYLIRLRNTGPARIEAGRIQVRTPVPEGVRFLPGSAGGAGALVEYAVDGMTFSAHVPDQPTEPQEIAAPIDGGSSAALEPGSPAAGSTEAGATGAAAAEAEAAEREATEGVATAPLAVAGGDPEVAAAEAGAAEVGSAPDGAPAATGVQAAARTDAETAGSRAFPATDPGAVSGAEASAAADPDEGAAAAAGTGVPAPALTIRWTYQQPLDPGAEAEVFFHVRLL